MNIDERQILIIQFNPKTEEWEDITKRVQWFDGSGNACRIKYSGNDTFYWKSWDDLRIINKPLTVNIVGKIIFCDKVPVYGLREVIQFNSYFKLYYGSGYTKLVEKNRIKIVSDITETREIKNFIEYLKAVAVLMPTEDGQNFLLKQLEKLTVLDDSVLGKFLQGKLGRRDNKKIIIFPFDTNSSQRVAVERALEEDLSVIQGPPGTGKTETIRNIVANYVARGGSVAVVSGNNEATRNVKDKFESTGFGYLNAFLGNSENVKKFFESPHENVRQIEKIDKTNSEHLLKEASEGAETYLKYGLDTEIISAFFGSIMYVIPSFGFALLAEHFNSGIMHRLPQQRFFGIILSVRQYNFLFRVLCRYRNNCFVPPDSDYYPAALIPQVSRRRALLR